MLIFFQDNQVAHEFIKTSSYISHHHRLREYKRIAFTLTFFLTSKTIFLTPPLNIFLFHPFLHSIVSYS